MKPILLTACFLVVLSSCNHYNYLTVSGKNVVKNEKSQLVAETDTLRVQYSFSENDGKIGFEILNKTDEMVEIDWKKSAIILGDQAVSLFNSEATLSGRVQSDVAPDQRVMLAPPPGASLNARILISEPNQFIFPKSFIAKWSASLPFRAQVNGLDSLKKREGEKLQLLSNGFTPVSYKRFQFSADQSPLLFRSFLTFRIGKEGNQKEFTQEHFFLYFRALAEYLQRRGISRKDGKTA
ncbi:MAG TPA: hypothetical protein VMR70_13715 [Flavisolibacter sp.]|nr:hypothetical protein [Flavisolibacter sp.]